MSRNIKARFNFDARNPTSIAVLGGIFMMILGGTGVVNLVMLGFMVFCVGAFLQYIYLSGQYNC